MSRKGLGRQGELLFLLTVYQLEMPATQAQADNSEHRRPTGPVQQPSVDPTCQDDVCVLDTVVPSSLQSGLQGAEGPWRTLPGALQMVAGWI